MKSFFKCSAISLAVLSLSGSVFAAGQMTGAFLGVEGLYLQPRNGDLDYVTTYPALSMSGLTASSDQNTITNHSISTDHNWDWRVYGGIKFTDNDDITLSWMRMRTSDSSSISANNHSSDSYVYLQPRFLFDEPWENVRGHVTFDLDDIYGVWGHTINFNNPWSVRFAAGLEYAKLDSDLTVTANAPNGFPIFVLQQPAPYAIPDVGFTAENTMKGIGPRVEFDMTYHLPYGFALFGKTNAALLVAERDISLEPVLSEFVFGTNPQTDPTWVFFPSDYSTRHVVVPKFGARLGASYSYTFGQAGAEGMGGTTLTVDAGWQAEAYIHAIERPDYGNFAYINDNVDIAKNQIYLSGNASTKVSNFTNQGLFLGVSVSSDWM